ncbi:MAG: hypothetical protein IPL87_00090 [Candidatus Moraniibacteriota bacterium]|nr:MAG: hypothetical protein IPL87_00090 [Candidatus Moranbacteria bacterium]
MSVREELRKYNPALLKKPEWVFVSRADEVDPEHVKALVAALAEKNERVSSLSILDDVSLDRVKHILSTQCSLNSSSDSAQERA